MARCLGSLPGGGRPPPSERQAFVESASPNPETAAKVLDLLARLELQDQTNATVTPDARTAEWAHLRQAVRPVVITAPLGRGGMGGGLRPLRH